jgi:hypothetical protein
MGKGSSERAARFEGGRSLVNTGASLPSLDEARERVLHFQCKLHEWASTTCQLDTFVESRMLGNGHVRFGRRRRGNLQPRG